MQQRRVSPHTISSYRDTFRQFFKFTQQQLHKPPSALAFEQIVAPYIEVGNRKVPAFAVAAAATRGLRSVRRNRSSIRDIVTSYVALLRAVNVGGKTLAMSAVRHFAFALGLGTPRASRSGDHSRQGAVVKDRRRTSGLRVPGTCRRSSVNEGN
jgi:Protein of unknown function (DUF1697)